jgi:DNA-binding GntR family transcriptional regulator
MALELAALDRVIDRLDDVARQRLQAMLVMEQGLLQAENVAASDLQRFHRELAQLSGDPAIALFLDVLLGLMVFQAIGHKAHRRRAAFVAVVCAGHAAIADAVLAADRPRARASMERYLRGLTSWIS